MVTVPWFSRVTTNALGIAFIASVFSSSPASAGPIPFNQWLQFAFTDPGVSTTGCFPTDPAGDFCLASSGTPTLFLDAPPWTFSLIAPATLKVTDAFTSGDQFELLNFGVPFAMTSLPVPLNDCGDDPVPCFADANMSTLSQVLAPGNYSLTIAPLAAPDGPGSAYFIVETAAVPEPSLILLIASGIALGLRQRNRRTSSSGFR
jgi:hypothetical protein